MRRGWRGVGAAAAEGRNAKVSAEVSDLAARAKIGWRADGSARCMPDLGLLMSCAAAANCHKARPVAGRARNGQSPGIALKLRWRVKIYVKRGAQKAGDFKSYVSILSYSLNTYSTCQTVGG